LLYVRSCHGFPYVSTTLTVSDPCRKLSIRFSADGRHPPLSCLAKSPPLSSTMAMVGDTQLGDINLAAGFPEPDVLAPDVPHSSVYADETVELPIGSEDQSCTDSVADVDLDRMAIWPPELCLEHDRVPPALRLTKK